MIPAMSLRAVVVAWLIGCFLGCGSQSSESRGEREPVTAREKQRREAKAHGGLDREPQRWGGWRYQGDRDDCFYVIGRHCFKSRPAACEAARCKAPKKCDVSGGGPATVSCK